MKKLDTVTNFSKEKYLRESSKNINSISKILLEKYKPNKLSFYTYSDNRRSEGQKKA